GWSFASVTGRRRLPAPESFRLETVKSAAWAVAPVLNAAPMPRPAPAASLLRLRLRSLALTSPPLSFRAITTICAAAARSQPRQPFPGRLRRGEFISDGGGGAPAPRRRGAAGGPTGRRRGGGVGGAGAPRPPPPAASGGTGG